MSFHGAHPQVMHWLMMASHPLLRVAPACDVSCGMTPAMPAGEAPGLPGTITNDLIRPLLDAFEVLIPASIAVMGVHKLAEHKDAAVSVIVDMIVKGGGAIMGIEVVKLLVGM